MSPIPNNRQTTETVQLSKRRGATYFQMQRSAGSSILARLLLAHKMQGAATAGRPDTPVHPSITETLQTL
jgi:hypothetical protein